MGLFDLNEKIAVITGGTRGIGLAIALGMKQAGATVWIHGRVKETTSAVAEQYGFHYIYGDLKQPEVLDDMLKPFMAAENRLDILVNNAGFEEHSLMAEVTGDMLDSIYHVNARSPFYLTQKLLPLLKKSSAASIINVTSIHQTVPVRGNGPYCIAKAALAMFTKVIALELAGDNIRVNNLAPGAILTDMNRELVEQMDFEQWIPMERVGQADELAGPAIFLASAASSYVTGTTLYVDGGYRENLLRY